MLQAICRKRPRQVMPEDVSDPGLLGAGEHGLVMVAEGQQVGQPPNELDNTDRTQSLPCPGGAWLERLGPNF